MASCDYDGGCGQLHAQIDAQQAQQSAQGQDEPSEIDRSRRCARDRRCPDKQRVLDGDGDPVKVKDRRGRPHIVYVGAQLSVERGLCTICTQTVRNEIPHLAADWRELAGLIAATGDTPGEAVSSSRDLPVPIRLSVEALMRAIDVETTVWAEQVADAIGADFDIEAAWTSRPHVRVEAAVQVLTDTTDTLVQLPEVDRDRYYDGIRHHVWKPDPDGDELLSTDVVVRREYPYWQQDGLDAALRMLELHDRTRILAGRGELVHRLPAPCPNPRCGRLSLVRPNGKDHVECETCHERWPEADYVRLTMILSDEENRRIKACGRCDKTGRLPNRRMCNHAAQRAAAA